MKTLFLGLSISLLLANYASAQSFASAYTDAKAAIRVQEESTINNPHAKAHYSNDHTIRVIRKEEYNEITWSTINDGDSYFYLLTKSSDGKTFKPFKVINLQHENKNSYTVIDSTPSTYYKIIQVDWDWNKFPSTVKTADK